MWALYDRIKSLAAINTYKNLLFYLTIYCLFISLMGLTRYAIDADFWKVWSIYLLQNGIGNMYYSGSDYPPLYYYILSGYATVMGSKDSIVENIHWLKAITFIFEFGSIFLLFRYVKKEFQLWFFLLILLNPGFFYNSLIWGQVDGIFSFLLLCTLLLAVNRYNTLAMLCYILCINFKVQGIIFLPLIFLLMLNNISDYKGIRHALLSLLALVSLQTLIILPFIRSETVPLLIETLLNSVGKYPMITLNAYNIWYWLFEGNQTSILDTGTFLSITYRTWGLIMFFITSIGALWPLFINCLSNAIQKNKENISNKEQVFLTAALITVLFFFFNTQMHERYSHYGMICLAAYFALTRNYWPFLVYTIAYFLNMERVMQAMELSDYTIVIFREKCITGLFLIVIIYLYYLIYKSSTIETDLKQLNRFLKQ